MKTVKFTRHWGAYNAGDIAGFLPQHADELIAKKIAKPFVEDVKDAAPIRKGATESMIKKSAKSDDEPKAE